MDPDVQDELQAMSGVPKVPLFGGVRTLNKGDLRAAKLSRPIFSSENSGPSINALNAIQQPIRNFSPPPPLPQSVPVLSTMDKATKIELEAILRRPAHTPLDKFKVLEARDKLIRLTTVKNVDINKATSTQGVCPDMCPEKERLSRESKNRVEPFESENGSKSVMNHKMGVKEYSRSSADQETPLPHELRPEPVLKLTMTYLLQNIMDLCDDPDTSIGEWYQFVWDRTRSIRKDITQQELCSTETVLLIEQCARFHIHCAGRLVAEEPSVFDHRINTENLTKCLQSLKYIYHDLDLKRIRCPNESEFRAYVVLLNLHDSNFLWEVKQLREEIQQSPEIQFAIKVYLAIESNNYVKFFSLVRSTTYMNACILLRYFTQVRVKALHIMFKAYAPRNPVYMPISNLTYLLAFEDAEQCAQFLEYYGLSVDRDDDRVLLDRNSFYLPDIPYILDRAINVVEHKRHSSVGEVVHGAPLDMKSVLEKYEPHDSFDENGLLLLKAWTADDQNYYKPEARIEARMQKSVVPDESVFKMPLAPPKSSPKSRLSPKPMVSAENAFSAPSNASSIFGSNKLTPSTQNSSGGFFKIQSNQQPAANNVFGSFGQSTPQPSLFGNATSNDTSAGQQPKPFDTFDGNSFKFTSNTPFGTKATENTAPNNSIFSTGFSQKPDTGLGLGSFAQVKPTDKTNLFGNAASNAQPSIFGGFSSAASNESSKNTGFMGRTTFQTTTSSSVGTGLFGGFKGNSTSIAGVVPLKDTDNELAKKVEKEKEAARRKEEEERKKKEAEEKERKRKAELEEQERRKKAEEEKKRQLELERKRREIEKASEKYVEELIGEFVSNNLKEIAATELKRYREVEEAINKTYTDIVNEVIDAELKRIAFDVKTAWDKNILERYFACWRKLTRQRKQQRQKIANTPAWLPAKSMQELIPELQHPLQAKTLSLMKRYRSGLPSKLIAPPVREDSIDLWSIIAPELIKLTAQTKLKQMQNIYWKCAISLPDTDEDPSCQAISQWLDNVFNRQVSKFPRQNDIFFVEQHDIYNQRVNVCMRKFTGKKLLNESQKMLAPKDAEGTNAILFFMTTKKLHETRERLKAVLQTIELNNAAGLIIYSLDTSDLDEIKNVLNLYDFMDYDKVDECIFANNLRNRGNNLCHLTKTGLKYVAANSFYDDQLELQQIVSFLRICLADELWQRIYMSVSRNPTLLEATTQFSFLKDYHNEAIDRLISVCTPSCIDSPTLFPFELRQFVPQHQLDIPLGLEYFPENWHQTAAQHQEQLTNFLKSLQIHQQIDLKNVTEIPELEESILKFVRAHIPSKSDADRTAYKMIQHILAYLSPERLDKLEFKEKLAKYSWLDAFPIFATDLLSYQYQRYCSEQRLPNYVIYDKYEYQDYIRTAWWLQTNEELLKDLTTNVLRNINAAVDEYEQTCKRQRLEDTVIAAEEKKKLDEILKKGYESLAKADKTHDRMKEIQTTCKDISKDLDHNLYRQEKFMRDMRHTLKDFNE